MKFRAERYDGEIRLEPISSPVMLAQTEQLRQYLAAKHKLSGTPADIFVFAKGEPHRPYLTKFGGRPFWPEGRAVPTDPSGKPMRFIAQLCFLDSLDIIKQKLPGDTLVVFDSWSPDEAHKDYYSFTEPKAAEWVTRDEVSKGGLATGLDSYLDFVAHGEIHRTADYVTEKDIDCLYDVFDRGGHLLPSLAATRVGPGAFHPQRTWSETPTNEVGCLYSLQPPKVWPFTNLEHTDRVVTGWAAEFSSGYRFLVGDAGGMYFELEDDGTVSIDESC